MVEVHPGLYVGDEQDFERTVAAQPGWAVVHACKEPHHRQALGYTGRGAPKDDPEYLVARRGERLMLNIVDAPDPAFFDRRMVTQALDFIDEARAKGLKVLVHCNLGESRSPSIALLYLAARLRVLPSESLEDAEREFAVLYPKYRPSAGIRGHLAQHWTVYNRRLAPR